MWLTQKRHLYKLCSRWRCLTSTAVKVFMFPQKICCWCCKLDLKCQRNRKQTGWGKRAQWHPTVQPLTHQALFLSIIFKRKFWFLLLWWGVKVFHRELRFTIYIYICVNLNIWIVEEETFLPLAFCLFRASTCLGRERHADLCHSCQVMLSICPGSWWSLSSRVRI